MTKNLTVNSALVVLKTIKARRNELIKLRDTVSVQEWYMKENKKTEPTYNVVDVDNKIVFLETQEFLLEQKIKESNAKTAIDYSVDISEILSPLS